MSRVESNFSTSASCFFLRLGYRKSQSLEDTTVDHADIRGVVPTFLASVGCLPHARAEDDTTPGRRLFRETLAIAPACGSTPPSVGLWWHRTLRGHGPQTGTPFPGHGDDNLMGMFARGPQRTLPCAEPPLGLPADRLERLRELCQAPWQGTAHCRRRPIGPGTVDHSTTGMGMPRVGHAAVRTPCPAHICRGRELQIMQALAGVLDARQGAQCGSGGDRDRALDTAEGLAGLDHRLQTPGVPLRVACACQTAQTCRLCRDGLDVFVKDHLRRRGGTLPCAQPAQGGGTPIGPPWRAASMPPHEGCASPRGRLPVSPGLFPRPTQGADRCIVDGRHLHRGEVPRAQEPGQWHGVTPVGCDPVARLCGPQRGSDHPAESVFLGQRPREPISTRAGFVDQDQGCSLRWALAHQRVDGTLPRAKRAEGKDRSVVLVGNLGQSTRVLMPIHADVKRARLGHGGPPRMVHACG
jgi:hypothetical protein